MWTLGFCGNTGLGSCDCLLTFASMDQNLSPFYICFSLKTPRWMLMVDLRCGTQSQQLHNLCVNGQANTRISRIFSVRHAAHSLWVLRHPREGIRLWLGDLPKREATHRMHNKCKKKKPPPNKAKPKSWHSTG